MNRFDEGINKFILVFLIPIIISLFSLIIININTSLHVKKMDLYDVSIAIITGLILSPIFEEYIFRHIPSVFYKKNPKHLHIVIFLSSAMFAVLHGFNSFLPLHFITGLLYSIIYYRYGIKFSIISHIFHNLPIVFIQILHSRTMQN